MKPTIEELVRAVGEHQVVSKRKITVADAQTSLLHDFGIYGDDVDDLISFIENKYRVKLDLREFQGKFPSEPHLFSLFWIGQNYPRFTFGMLADLIDRGQPRP